MTSPIIHLVKTRLVNSYVIEYPDKILIIDVAIKCHRYVLGFIEEQLNRSIDDVKIVACTHDDPDHIGGVQALAKLCSAQVAIPYASNSAWRKAIHDPYGSIIRLSTGIQEFFRPRAWAMYFNPFRDNSSHQQVKYKGKEKTHDEDFDNKKLKVNFRLKDNQQIPEFHDWTVIHTPGHSWDSCCFHHENSGSLITGDMLLGNGKKNQLVVAAIYSNRRHIKRSLLKLATLKIQSVYPGHGSIISGEGIIENARFS